MMQAAFMSSKWIIPEGYVINYSVFCRCYKVHLVYLTYLILTFLGSKK